MMKGIKIKKSIKGFFKAIFAFVVTLSLLFTFVLSSNSVYAKENNEVKNDSTPLVDPANCKHDLIEKEITVTNIVKTAGDSSQPIKYSEYKNAKVAGSTGVDLAFMGAKGKICAQGSAVVTVTINLEEARNIDVYWYVNNQLPYAKMKVEFTYSNEETTAETITYDYTNKDFIGWNVNSISCSAGVNKFTYKLYVSKGTKYWADPGGRHLYVLPEFSSAFDENDTCTLCGTKCTHETAGLGYDSEKDEYFFQCQDKCAHEVDILSYVENKDIIANIRKAYDKFTDEQKDKLPKEKLARLEKAESIIAIANVEDLITKLPAADDVTTNKKNDVYAVRTEYEKLKKEDKKEVNSELVEKLEAVELVLAQKLVEEELAKLPEADKITTSNKGVIEAARTAYDKLNEKQKAEFNADVLKNLEVAETKLANIVINEELAKLPEVDKITSQNKASIEAARKAYDSLSDEEKAKIAPEVIEKLEAAEIALAKVIFNEELAKIPDIDKITSQNKASIEAARKAYDSLSDEEKAKIAPEVIEKLEAAEKALAKAIFNEELDKLPEVDQITLNHKNSIEAAREAYESLPALEKEKIDAEKLEKLEAAEIALANVIINEYAKKLPEAVEDITINDKPIVEEVRKAYESLSDEEKAKIDPELIKKLEAAETKINDIEKVALVQESIDELPALEDLTLDDYETITSAKTKYDALTDEQKSNISKEDLEILNAIYKKANDIKLANDFEIIVDELGEISYNNETKEKLDAAIKFYNELTEDQKTLIADEYQQLQAALKDYEQKELDATRHSLSDKTTNVSIETSTGRGIPKDVNLATSSSQNVQAEKGSTEYNNIISKLNGNEKIHTVYNIKLTHVVDGVEKEVQPKDIQEGMKLIIRLAVPEGVNSDEARILHIHDKDNMEFVENVKVEENEFVFEVSSLSEFAVVVKTHGFPVWAIVLIVILALILLCGICYLLLFFVFNKWINNNGKKIRVFKLGKKNNKVKVITMFFAIKEIDEEELLETKDDVLESKEAEKVKKEPISEEEKEQKRISKHQQKLLELSALGVEYSKNVEVTEDENGIEAIGIIYSAKSKVYMFGPKEYKLNIGDIVKVKDSTNNIRTVVVVVPNKKLAESEIVKPFKDIEEVVYQVTKTNVEDIEKARLEAEEQARKEAEEKAREEAEEKAREEAEEKAREEAEAKARKEAEEKARKEAEEKAREEAEAKAREEAEAKAREEAEAKAREEAEEKAREEAEAKAREEAEEQARKEAEEKAREEAEAKAQEEALEQVNQEAEDETDEDETADDEADESDEDSEETSDNKEALVSKDDVVEFDEATKKYKVTKIKKTYEAKMCSLSDEVKELYSDVKNALLSYGLQLKSTKTAEKFRIKRNYYAQLKICGKQIGLYLALDPKEYAESKYKGKDLSDKKAYAATPFLYKFKTARKAKWALELVDALALKESLTKLDNYEPKDFKNDYPNLTEEELIEKGYIVKTVTITDKAPKVFHKVEEIKE